MTVLGKEVRTEMSVVTMGEGIEFRGPVTVIDEVKVRWVKDGVGVDDCFLGINGV